jgi:thiol-disulfide isomerase/thioredoxin
MEEIRICRICKKSSNETKITKYFDKRRNKQYYNSSCTPCKMIESKLKYKNNKIYRDIIKLRSTEYRNTETGFKSQLLHDTKKNKKFEDYELNLIVLNELQKIQNNKCSITGIELVWKPNNIYQASIDRIDSSKGYLKNNIQLVLHPINRMKLDYTTDKFKTIINEIKNNIDTKEEINIYKLYENNKQFKNKIKKIFTKLNSRKYKVEITIDDILNKLQESNMRCNLTNIKLTTFGWNALSVDRIDSDKDYTVDNIQIVCWAINCAKWSYDNTDFIQFINLIKNN